MSTTATDLNLRHLRAMLAIVTRGSVVAAAQDVSLSQPAVTQGIAGLERMLRARLFDRRPDGMTPTEAARLLGPRVAAAAEHMAAGARAIRRTGGGFAGADKLVTSTQIRALLALADGGGFVAAAQATGLAQPSLHRAVRDLERLFGAILVERRGRGVATTDAGRQLARALRLAVNEIDAGLADLSGLAGSGGGRVTIGAMPLARARLLPKAIARLHRAHPETTVSVIEGAHAELLQLLRDGRLDFLVGALRTPSPGPDIVQSALIADMPAVFARAAHPLAGRAAPTVQDLARFPWIIPHAGAPLRDRWRALFESAGVDAPTAPVECGSVMVIRGLLEDSDMLALMSPDQVALELRSGVLARLGAPLREGRREIGLSARADWRPSAAQAACLDLLREVASEIVLPEIE